MFRITEAVTDVSIQDQSSPGVIVKFSQIIGEKQLTVATAVNDWTITVTNSTSMAIGQYISIVNVTGNRYYVGEIVGIASQVITLDRPLDFAYQIDDYVAYRTTEMAVNGLVTPQMFSLRGAITEEIPLTIDITRIIFTCLTDGAVSLEKFGDLTALATGVTMRRKNGYYSNIFNVKTNLDLDGITLDWKPYASTNPSQGQDGFTCRLTFNGPDKMGIVERLGPGEDLEIIIPEDLTGLTLFECRAEGHVVVD